MNKLSAIIPCFNEELNISGAIESCLFADEIIVVDSFSTDKTVDIIKQYTKVKLIQHSYKNSAAQKNWTIPKAKYDWIFLLDADERANEKLTDEIKEIIKNPKHVAYWIDRENYFMDREIKNVWNSDSVIRLFRKSKCRYEEKHVHGEILANGTIGSLKNKIKHDTYSGKGLLAHLRKSEQYTTWAALDRVNKINNITYYHLVLKPFYAFIKRYIIKKGFLDGIPGLIISSLGAWNVFIRNVKVWRMHNGEKFN